VLELADLVAQRPVPPRPPRRRGSRRGRSTSTASSCALTSTPTSTPSTCSALWPSATGCTARPRCASRAATRTSPPTLPVRWPTSPRARRAGQTSIRGRSASVTRSPRRWRPATGLWDGHLTAHPDGRFTRVRDGEHVPLEVPASHRGELRALLELRDAAKELLGAEAAGVEDTDAIGEQRAGLRLRYDAYTGRYGPINRFSLRHTGRQGPETGEPRMARVTPRVMRTLRSADERLFRPCPATRHGGRWGGRSTAPHDGARTNPDDLRRRRAARALGRPRRAGGSPCHRARHRPRAARGHRRRGGHRQDGARARFLRRHSARVLWGACDALYTPRPLGPLLDIAQEEGGELAALDGEGATPGALVEALARRILGAALTSTRWGRRRPIDATHQYSCR
jgi:hypothetical protein